MRRNNDNLLILSVDALRNYVAASPRRKEWLKLGAVGAPSEVLSKYARTVCDLYALPSRQPAYDGPVPDVVAELNKKYWTTEKFGLTARDVIWRLFEVPGFSVPILTKILPGDWRNMWLPWRDKRDWRFSAARRNYERIIIVPRQGAE